MLAGTVADEHVLLNLGPDFIIEGRTDCVGDRSVFPSATSDRHEDAELTRCQSDFAPRNRTLWIRRVVCGR